MSKPWLDALQQQLASSASGGAMSAVMPTGGTVTLDIESYQNFRLVLDGSTSTIAPPTSGGAIAAGATFSLYLDQDASGNRAIPAFTGGAGGFASDTQAQIQAVAVGTPLTRTRCTFKYDGNIWFLDHIPYSGGATS